MTMTPSRPTARRYLVAAAVGAFVFLLGYLAVSFLFPYHSDGFYRDSYRKGYELGQGLMTDEFGSVKNGNKRMLCGAIGGSFYDQETNRTWTNSGGTAFTQGCADAVAGKPANPDAPYILPEWGSE